MFVSGGALVMKTPISALGSSWFPYMPAMSSGAWPSSYEGMYRGQLWVYVVVNKRSRATARLPLPVYRRDADNRPRVDDHAMAKLLRNPNPGLSAFDLWEWTSSTRDIHGEAFWLKRRENGVVTQLFPLHPAYMTPAAGAAARWDFDNGSLTLRDIPSSDLVHFKSYLGVSPLEPLRSTLANEWHARTATTSFWEKGARPGVALSHPGRISESATQRLRAQWDALASGSGNTGGSVILEEGMVPKVLTLTAEEAQYIETRKLNREEVCAAYDIPPPVVHILDHATFSNITEQMRSMYRDTMAPHLKSFEATIELDLRQAEWPNDDVYAEFLMDEVLRGDFEARQDALQKASHMTIAEKRKIENLPFIAGTDRIFLNTATMPLDAIDAQAAALAERTAQRVPAALTAAEEPNPAPLPVTAARSVMGRLSWQQQLDQIDPDALTEGLPLDTKAAVLDALGAAVSVRNLRDRVRSLAAKDFPGGN